MISARLSRQASHETAVFVRLAAALALLVTAILVPWMLADAALGHATLRVAGITVAVTLGSAVVATLAARSLDPLRR